jgi:hypothetical protein
MPHMSKTVATLAIVLSSLVLDASRRPLPAAAGAAASMAEVPARLSDQQFWRLIEDSSEPGGYFRSENITNLTSNELWFQYVIPDLVARTRPGAVYLGVGPEQNFTYIAAVKPKLAVIFDIRRGNLDLQLMYKALFELSADRADFVSKLFARSRPAGLSPSSTVIDVFRAVGALPASEAVYTRTLQAIETHLTKTHAFPVRQDDLAGVRLIYEMFYRNGFAVRASPTYADLMTATDQAGVSRGYLADEASFQVMKDLESRNLVVPVVGDFGGPKAIRAIGAYLRSIGGTVSAFYLSNVEQYLVQDGKWDTFCRNVAALPLDATSTFIRSSSGGGGGGGFGRGFVSSLGAMQAETQGCAARTP